MNEKANYHVRPDKGSHKEDFVKKYHTKRALVVVSCLVCLLGEDKEPILEQIHHPYTVTTT